MEWIGFWGSIIGSIIGGLIGGLFTYLGVRMTINLENKKMLEKSIEEKNKNKPRLEMVSKTELKKNDIENKSCSDLDVITLHIESYSRYGFHYDEKSLIRDNLYYKEYVFRNTGLTEIESICVTNNLQKDSALFELDNYELFIKEKLLNYEGWCKKHFIKEGEKVTIRFYYVGDGLIVSNLGNPTITLWLKDVNGNIWKQALSVEEDLIYYTCETSYKDFRDAVDIETALKCFENPYLW